MLAVLASLAVALSLAPASFRARGLNALDFIDRNFRLDGGLIAEYHTPDGTPAGPSTIQAGGVMLSALNAAAELDRARLPAAVAYAKALDAYRWQKPGDVLGYQPFPVGKAVGDMYYDDNQWLVMGFLDTYKLSGDEQFLTRAHDACAYLASGESDDLGGGIWWADTKKQKNTCSNAPAIVAALSLYEIDKKPEPLALAERL